MDPEGDGIELSFTELRVVDWPRAVRWYVEALGLRLVLEDVGHQFALLEAGVCRLALKGGKRRVEPASSNVRLVFRVRDIDAERRRLIALGIDVEPALDHLAEAYRAVTLVDPESTPITLFSWSNPPDSAK